MLLQSIIIIMIANHHTIHLLLLLQFMETIQVQKRHASYSITVTHHVILALYPTTDDRVLHTMANLTLSDNSQPWMHPQQPTSVPYHLPPLMQYQYLPNGQDNLSNSLEELHLPTTNDSSAGLNNYHGGYMQP
jgi:hypothetical protein